MVTRLMILTCLTVGLWLAQSPAVPANDAEPQVRLVQSSADRLLKDLDPVMRLTSPADQEMTQKIREYLDLSFVGMDLNKLIRMDFITGDGPLRYRPAFPIQNEQIFWRQNLNPNGIQTNRLQTGLYLTTGAFDGFLRTQHGYAIFAEKRKDLNPQAPPPPDAVAHLLDLTDNAAMELKNTPEDVDFRRKSYNNEKLGLRQELKKQIVKSKSESADAFELRQLSTEHMLDHLERLYVEAEYSRLLAHFNPVDATTRLDFKLEPIPDTDLAKHVQQMNQEPISFANVPRAENSDMSLRVRMPLDELQKRHMTETIALLRRIAHTDVKENTVKTEAQKQATDQVVDLIFDLLQSNVEKGLADGFFESHPDANGTNTAIGAAKVKDGETPLEILQLLEKTRDGQEVKMNIANANGVAIHSFLVSKEQYPAWSKFFGGLEMYVGTSKDTIWLGAGPQAVEELQAAVREVAKPNTGSAEDPFLTLSGRAAPWLEFHKQNYPDTGSEMFRKYRNLLAEAGQPGDDQFDLLFNRDGDNVVGNWTGKPGWARFVGKYLADMFK